MSEPIKEELSRSTGHPACYGFSVDGRLLFCVYRLIDDVTIEPVTAYEVGEDL